MLALKALALSSRGLPVFPVRQNQKRPARKGWQQIATCDAVSVIGLFDGTKYNIGVSTNGLVVLDCDKDKGGLDTLANLGPLPETLTVRTPSGGVHKIFRPAEGDKYQTDVDVLPGIDIRAEGGLIVGAGSTFDGREYVVEVDAPIAPLPPHVATQLKAYFSRPRRDLSALTEDMRGAAEQATRYLTTAAPPGVEGSRNGTAFKVAARVIDFGLTWQTAAGLMSELWDCEPALDDTELEAVCRNAAQHRKEPAGVDNAWDGFAPVPAQIAQEVVDKDTRERIRKLDLSDERIAGIKPRKWIVNRRLLRGKVTMIIADAGAGKTTLSLQWSAAVAHGGDFAKALGLDVRESVPVLVINGEDEHEELERRLAAVALRFKPDYARLNDRLHISSGSNDPWSFVVRGQQRGVLVETEAANALIRYIKQHGIGVVVIDPLLEMHDADENSNPEMRRVMAVFRRIAEQGDCAVLVIHHSRKPSAASADGHAGNMASSRGASSVSGVARVMYTLYEMTDADAERFGVPKHQKHRYARLDDAKFQFGLASPRAQWFEKFGQPLPCGEDVGVLVPVVLADKTEAQNATLLDVLAQALKAGQSVALSAGAKLIADNPMCAGLSPSALAKRLMEAFEGVGFAHKSNGLCLQLTAASKSGGLIVAVAV